MIWSLPLGPPFPMMPKISYRNAWHTISKTECMPPTFWNINGSRELPAPSSTPRWWNKHLWACLSSMQTRSFSKPLWQWWLKIWLQKQKLPNSKKYSMNLTQTKMASSNTMSSLAAIKSSMELITPRRRSIESLISLMLTTQVRSTSPSSLPPLWIVSNFFKTTNLNLHSECMTKTTQVLFQLMRSRTSLVLVNRSLRTSGRMS